MISVPMIVYNDEKYIADAINAVLNQSYKNFELIIIDDCSTDNSYNIAKSFKDKRIRLYKNIKNKGITDNRNASVALAKSRYLFFTDSDCVVDKNWIKQGLKYLMHHDCLGIEGLTYYVHKGYRPTLSDKMPGTVEEKGHYMTCNIAYKKDVIIRAGGFRNEAGYNSDREISFRIKKIGNICYNKEMIVTHQKKLWTVKDYIKSANRITNRVIMYKYHNDNALVWHKILYPKNLIKILIPPLILIPLFRRKVRSLNDVKIMFAAYPKIIYERFLLWKTAIKEKVFLI